MQKGNVTKITDNKNSQYFKLIGSEGLLKHHRRKHCAENQQRHQNGQFCPSAQNNCWVAHSSDSKTSPSQY